MCSLKDQSRKQPDCTFVRCSLKCMLASCNLEMCSLKDHTRSNLARCFIKYGPTNRILAMRSIKFTPKLRDLPMCSIKFTPTVEIVLAMYSIKCTPTYLYHVFFLTQRPTHCTLGRRSIKIKYTSTTSALAMCSLKFTPVASTLARCSTCIRY